MAIEFKPGDIVTITHREKQIGWGDSWVNKMDDFIGQECTILEYKSRKNCYSVAWGEFDYNFPLSVIKLYKPIEHIDVKMDIFEIGDIVTITHKISSCSNGWRNSWVGGMDNFIGKKCIIHCNNNTDGSYDISYCGEHYNFPLDVVKLYEPKPELFKVFN